MTTNKNKPSLEVVERFSKFTDAERYQIIKGRLTELYGAIPKDNKEVGYVYVLRLSNNMFYVGHTTTPKRRMMKHFSIEGGSQMTRAYPADNILSITQGTTKDEDRLTIQLMKEHGLANVRGGKWCKEELAPYRIKELNKRGVY